MGDSREEYLREREGLFVDRIAELEAQLRTERTTTGMQKSQMLGLEAQLETANKFYECYCPWCSQKLEVSPKHIRRIAAQEQSK
jgi:hypothetical protein